MVQTCGLLAALSSIPLGLVPPRQPPLVEFWLDSPSHGATVAAGTAISWSVRIAVEPSTNIGLAAFAVDLLQDASNPGPAVLEPGNTAPPTASGFSRPAGISNKTPSGLSAFGGTPMGPVGTESLREIGGAQNTFGAAAGGIGLDTQPEPAIGQGPAPTTVVSGNFLAPSSAGTYCFYLDNALANVLLSIASPGQVSPVTSARTAVLSNICFTVVPACDPDYTADGNVDQSDIACLVDLISGSPGCSTLDPDFNHDGNADQADVAALVAVVAGEPCP